MKPRSLIPPHSQCGGCAATVWGSRLLVISHQAPSTLRVSWRDIVYTSAKTSFTVPNKVRGSTMCFAEVTKMQSRQSLVSLIVHQRVSVSEACRMLGVSRPTAYKWLERAERVGLEGLHEESRKPRISPKATPAAAEARLLELKDEHPTWGAKKLVSRWPGGAPVSLRTADRILKRHGKVGQCRRGVAAIRFEREECNELWQMDFKGVGQRGYGALSVIDDCSRFCLGFDPLVDRRAGTTFEALWRIFGEFGMPACILSDNGAPFNSVRGEGPTPLQAKLWLLGIRTIHGRPYHPQTQGKVERFHGTAERDIGPLLRLASMEDVARAMAHFRHEYNWIRPHEALEMASPGQVYAPSVSSRPSQLPRHQLPEGAQSRKVDASGKFSFKSVTYRAGKGLSGQYVEIREEEADEGVYFAGVRFASLHQVRV